MPIEPERGVTCELRSSPVVEVVPDVVEPVEPVDPVEPLELVEPVDPVIPLVPLMPDVPADPDETLVTRCLPVLSVIHMTVTASPGFSVASTRALSSSLSE